MVGVVSEERKGGIPSRLQCVTDPVNGEAAARDSCPQGPGGPVPLEQAPGWGLGVQPRALRTLSRAWPRHRPKAKGTGKGLLRA